MAGFAARSHPDNLLGNHRKLIDAIATECALHFDGDKRGELLTASVAFWKDALQAEAHALTRVLNDAIWAEIEKEMRK